MVLLKTLLVLLLAYYLIKTLAGMFAPKIMGYASKKAEEHLNRQFEAFANRANGTFEQEGDIIIDKRGKTKKKASKEVGEYIDFEEIE